MQNHFVVIMAGGIGSRFWPMSRSAMPKQFLDILGVGKSLLQQTYDRLRLYFPKENIYVITTNAYTHLVREHLPELAVDQILGEPVAKNTAPCVAYSIFKIKSKNPNATVVIAPSDHLILDEQSFIASLQQSLEFAEKKSALVALGIKPFRPDTGYGYIQFKEKSEKEMLEDPSPIKKVKTFTEKPNLELAQRFLDSGDFLWNAGIFIWSVNSILESFKVYLNEIYQAFEAIEGDLGTANEPAAVAEVYGVCSNISIDYGVLEKAENVFVLPASFGWSDLGTWASLYEMHKKDDHYNAVNGKLVEIYESSDCMVSMPANKLAVIKGVKNLIIADSADALMICPIDMEQEVKQIVSNLKVKFGDRFA
jgi:mannose-1-phosphate guanylyltransferase